MLSIYMNKLTYDYDDDGTPIDATIGFSSGMTTDGQYIYAVIKLTKNDLGGKTFDDLSPKDLLTIGRNKLYSEVKPTTTAAE